MLNNVYLFVMSLFIITFANENKKQQQLKPGVQGYRREKVMKYNMSEIMKRAHNTFRLKGSVMSFGECLKQSWQVAKLQSRMKNEVVEFFFTKVNGETRQAFGSLIESHITYVPNGRGNQTAPDCIKFWDEVKGEWRQFKSYNFLRIAQ